MGSRWVITPSWLSGSWRFFLYSSVYSCHLFLYVLLLLDPYHFWPLLCPSVHHDGVISHLDPNILECEVKWALGNINMNKVSGGDGISVELFQILTDDAVKVLHSICQQIWKLSSGHRTRKVQFSFQSQRKAMPKNILTTAQSHSSHMLAK